MKTTLPLKLLSIDNDGAHLALKAKINGKVAHLILDTGASRSVFDTERIDKFFKGKTKTTHVESSKLSSGLGTNTMKSKTTELKTLQLGDLIIKTYPTVLLDLSHVNQSYSQAGLKAIDGVLGNDILMKYKALIDYRKKELILSF